MQNSLWRQIGNRLMPLTSSVMRQSVSNFRLHCCSKKFQMLQKNVKSLLGQLQVCIFAEIVFGVRCTLILFSHTFRISSIFAFGISLCYHLPFSFDHSKLWMPVSRCQGILINKKHGGWTSRRLAGDLKNDFFGEEDDDFKFGAVAASIHQSSIAKLLLPIM